LGLLHKYKMKFDRITLSILGILIIAPSIPLNSDLFVRDFHFIWMIFVLGAIIMVIINTISQSETKLPASFTIAFVLLCLGYMIGLFVAKQTDTAMLEVSRRIAVGVVIIIIAPLFRSKKNLLFVAKFMAVALMSHAIYGVVQLFSLKSFFDGVVGVPGHANVYAYLIVVGYPLVLGVVLEKDSPKFWKIFGWIAICSSLLMVPFTWSAGAILALVIPWMLMGAYAWYNKHRTAAIGISISGLVVIVGVFLWLTGAGKISVFSRMDNIEVAWELIKEKPVTGIGSGQLLYRFPDFRSADDIHYPGYTAVDPRDHIHLEPLQVYMDAGIPGVSGLLLLLLIITPATLKKTRDKIGFIEGKAIWLCFAAAVIQGAVSLAPARQGAIVLVVALGLAISQMDLKLKKTNIKPALFMLALLLISGFYYHVKRVTADYYYAKGRDQSLFWAAKDMDALRKVPSIWPEELEARNLLTSAICRRIIHLPPRAEEQLKLIEEGVSLTEQTMVMSPQYQKAPVLHASLLMASGDTLNAYNTLVNADRFINDPYYQTLLQSAEKCVLKHND